MPWSRDAGCARPPWDTANWWPAKESRPSRFLELFEVCAKCPVRRPCLELALETRASGAWAATRDSDRAGLIDNTHSLAEGEDPHDHLPPPKADVQLAADLLEADFSRRLTEVREITATWPGSRARWRAYQHTPKMQRRPKALSVECLTCRREFTTTKAPPPAYCSKRCRSRAVDGMPSRPLKPPEEKTCPECGVSYRPSYPAQRFCSQRCHYDSRRLRRPHSLASGAGSRSPLRERDNASARSPARTGRGDVGALRSPPHAPPRPDSHAAPQWPGALPR